MVTLAEVVVCITVLSTPYAPPTLGPCYPLYPNTEVATMEKCRNLGAIIAGMTKMKIEEVYEVWTSEGRLYPPMDPPQITCKTK